MEAEKFTDAIALLKADHRKVEELFAKYETARDSAKQKLAEQICTELKIHTAIEEEIYYPALAGKVEEDLLNEAYVEHVSAKKLIDEIMAGSPEDQLYDAKVKVLSEEIEHHVKEEEAPKEGIFSQSRAAEVDLVALRDQMAARKAELMEASKSGNMAELS